ATAAGRARHRSCRQRRQPFAEPGSAGRERRAARDVRVDAHVHFWGPHELAAYEWMTDDMDAIRRPFAPDDLRPLLAAHAFDGAVVVQTYSSVEETRAVLELAARTELVLGVVGWVDLTSPDVGETLAGLNGPHLAAT